MIEALWWAGLEAQFSQRTENFSGGDLVMGNERLKDREQQGAHPDDGEAQPMPKRRVRTISELLQKAKSRRYSAAMHKRWKGIRAEERARQQQRWTMGAPPLSPEEQASIDEALAVGVLVIPDSGAARYVRLRNIYWETLAWKARYDRGRTCPCLYVVITMKKTTVDIEVDMPSGNQHFTEDAIGEANRLLERLSSDTAQRPGRKLEWWGWRDDGGLVCHVPINDAPELIRALLALPVCETREDGTVCALYNAPPDGMEIWD